MDDYMLTPYERHVERIAAAIDQAGQQEMPINCDVFQIARDIVDAYITDLFREPSEIWDRPRIRVVERERLSGC